MQLDALHFISANMRDLRVSAESTDSTETAINYQAPALSQPSWTCASSPYVTGHVRDGRAPVPTHCCTGGGGSQHHLNLYKRCRDILARQDHLGNHFSPNRGLIGQVTPPNEREQKGGGHSTTMLVWTLSYLSYISPTHSLPSLNPKHSCCCQALPGSSPRGDPVKSSLG